MKILLLIRTECEAQRLMVSIEDLGHRVLYTADPELASNLLLEWQPDLFITEDKLARRHPDAGLRLAELCRFMNETTAPRSRQVLMLAQSPDWEAVKRARQTGAHVIVKSSNLDATIRYVQVIVDDLITDRRLGPILFAMHRSPGISLTSCQDCEWVGASVSYGRSQTDLQLTGVRTAILNALLFLRRGQSAAEIMHRISKHRFLNSLLKGRLLRESAIKMEVSRLRGDIENGLRELGAPYSGNHFVPPVHHGFEKYRLCGNCHLSHLSPPN